MKTQNSQQRTRGSVLVVGLLLVVVGTLGMASMTTLLAGRSRLVTDMELSSQRRIAIKNNRAMVHHYFMRQGIGNSDDGGTIDLSGWGKLVVPSTTDSPFESQQEFSLINFLSPGGERGFTQDVDVSFRQPDPYGTGESSRNFRVMLKSRSPLLGGTLLVQHKPATVVTGVETDVQGSIQVNGNVQLWKDDQLYGDVGNFLVKSYDHPDQIAVGIKGLDNTQIPPTNFPFYARSTGYDTSESSGAPVVDGTFNMFEIDHDSSTGSDPTIAANTLYHKMVTYASPLYVDGAYQSDIGGVAGDEIDDDDGTGSKERRISVNLNNPGVSPVIVNDGVHHLRVLGYTDSANADNEPAGFILVRSNDLETITFENNNFRRLVLGIRGDYEPVELYPMATTATSGNWRILLTVEGAGLNFNMASGATFTLQGGIRTDSRLSVPNGTLILNREPSPEQLGLIDPREAWIEVYGS